MDQQDHNEPTLSAGDAEAIDRWMRDRDNDASPAAKLMALLGSSPADLDETDATLVDATVLRITRAATAPVASPEPELDPRSADAFDAWALAGYSADKAPSSLRDRAERIEQMAELIVAGDTPAPSADLVERTMARLDETAAQEPIPFRPSRFRIADLVSVAAVLLIAGSILWPMMASARATSQRQMCAANLGNTGNAFSAYTTSNDGRLPIATAGFAQMAPRRAEPIHQPEPEAPWWEVGSRERPANSAHLFVLVRASYADLSDLACPGNPMAPRMLTDPQAVDWSSLDEISYSYQLSTGTPARIWNRPSRAILLADRSPVVERAIRGEKVNPFTNSDNHDRRGQHVLHADGSADWLTRPVLDSGDNIWLPRQIERMIEASRVSLRGVERPEGPDDAFVGP